MRRTYPGLAVVFIPRRNPRPQRSRKEITDRAWRYRATAHPPPGPKICCLCGATRHVEVGHANGHEENCSSANLLYTCRRCNVQCANTLRRAGLGRLTRQYNPSSAGAENLGQWMNAVMSMKGDPGGNMAVADAVAIIRATPPYQRSRFAKQIWRLRRTRGTDGPVPF